MLSKYQSAILITFLCFSTGLAAPPADKEKPFLSVGADVVDVSTYIDANTIFMFVANHGVFARDIAGVFGYAHGTFYPVISTEYIEDGTMASLSPLYASGIWLAGRVNNVTRVAIAGYNSEYWPGPMIAGTFDPDGDINPYYRVYKLYKDSSAATPNLDYLEYVDHVAPLGAPVDHKGRPLLRGDQTLWTVFNDANPAQHLNDAGETSPLGIEVQMSMWASDDKGKNSPLISDSIIYSNELDITHTGTITGVEVVAYVANPELITGNTYRVYFVDTDLSWNLLNLTTNYCFGCRSTDQLYRRCCRRFVGFSYIFRPGGALHELRGRSQCCRSAGSARARGAGIRRFSGADRE